MPNNRDSHTDFGSGFDWEDGAYPIPPKDIRERISEEVNSETSGVDWRELSTSDGSPDRDSKDDRSPISRFRGVLLDVVPSHTLYAPDSEEEICVGSLYLGSGQQWVRVNFWGNATERIADFADMDSNPTIEVNGITTNRESEILDLFVFENDDRTNVKQVDDSAVYMPNPISAESIVPESLVEMVRATVLYSVSATHESEGEKFDVQHLELGIRDLRFVVQLHDSHTNKKMVPGDTVYIFAGWGKDKRFIYNKLPGDENKYDSKFVVRDYSGIRNVSQNELP